MKLLKQGAGGRFSSAGSWRAELLTDLREPNRTGQWGFARFPLTPVLHNYNYDQTHCRILPLCSALGI